MSLVALLLALYGHFADGALWRDYAIVPTIAPCKGLQRSSRPVVCGFKHGACLQKHTVWLQGFQMCISVKWRHTGMSHVMSSTEGAKHGKITSAALRVSSAVHRG